jgi:hypothetical protein
MLFYHLRATCFSVFISCRDWGLKFCSSKLERSTASEHTCILIVLPGLESVAVLNILKNTKDGRCSQIWIIKIRWWRHSEPCRWVFNALTISVPRRVYVCLLWTKPYVTISNQTFERCYLRPIMCIVETQRRFNPHNFQIRKCEHSVTILVRSLKLPESDLRIQRVYLM